MDEQTRERLESVRISGLEIAESAENLLLDICGELQKGFEDSRFVDDQTKILIAVAKRAVNSSRAIKLLAANDDFYEDINVICRALVETIINGAYLQYATPLEVETYMGFDVIPISKTLSSIEKFAPGKLSEATPPVLRDAFQKRLADVKQATGKSEKDFGWTRLDVTARAQKIDQMIETTLFVFLAQGYFAHGHAFVHGNQRSLFRLQPGYEDIGAPTHFNVTQNLQISVTALVDLATFIIKLRLQALEYRAIGLTALLDGFSRQTFSLTSQFSHDLADVMAKRHPGK